MPYAYLYQCDRCEADVEIVLAREFRVDSEGRRVDYEYPSSELYEWPPKRVSGLWSRLWCPQCRRNRELVLVELEAPAEHPVQAFLKAEAGKLTGAESGPCSECGTTLLVDLDRVECPACEEGALRLIGEYEL
jgi:hypothetical protein